VAATERIPAFGRRKHSTPQYAPPCAPPSAVGAEGPLTFVSRETDTGECAATHRSWCTRRSPAILHTSSQFAALPCDRNAAATSRRQSSRRASLAHHGELQWNWQVLQCWASSHSGSSSCSTTRYREAIDRMNREDAPRRSTPPQAAALKWRDRACAPHPPKSTPDQASLSS
jgi:hypothetical protein